MTVIVIAPDSFKGTISAADAARALAEGWASVRSADELRLVPMADGGEGTLDAFELAVPGSRRMPVTVDGPDGRAVETSWLWLPQAGDHGPTGVVELASTSGITLLDPLLPFDAHSFGFGQAIAAALDAGVDRLLLALGGSSSTDGGAGALAALGLDLGDAAGRPIRVGNRGLDHLASIDGTGLRPLPPGGAVILSDVDNPLLGERGAAVVFGPQKGATPAEIEALEQGLARWASLVALSDLRVHADAATPGAGAAGGTGFGLLAWGATIAPGAAAVGAALGLPGALSSASVVITGEGRFDHQSLAGKVPSYVLDAVAEAAAEAIAVALVAGSIEGDASAFAASVSLTDLAGDSAAARAEPARWLSEAGAELARTLVA
ncbi:MULTISPECIES: glycerate kinase [unclassified Leifsonia]|uniref:glycerate kinase n=1 Tax=unclassified Leifsonia TaxID=2663824 RepID=UPI0006FFA124|nr:MULTISPECIES: glycerate kinase [unclassified Leifsonia]KQX05610.1 glycerate kinase [Leifsonia sp. Root1293]KRA09244.1 glycerate kinase [Leifsonia sp. Root60]